MNRFNALLASCSLLVILLNSGCKKDDVALSQKQINSADKLAAITYYDFPVFTSNYLVSTVVTGAASFQPIKICRASDGTIYVTTEDPNQISKVSPAGKLTLFKTFPDSFIPTGIKAGENGAVYTAMYFQHKIYKIDKHGVVKDIPVTVGLLNPRDIAIGPDSSLYIADEGNARIVKVTPNGDSFVFAGKTGVHGLKDGVGEMANFGSVEAVKMASDGRLWVLDYDWRNQGITYLRYIEKNGTVKTFYKGQHGAITDFSPIKKDKNFKDSPYINFFLAFSGTSGGYVPDLQWVSHLSNTGEETIIAGGERAFDSMRGLGQNSKFGYIYGITATQAGVFVTDNENNAIGKIFIQQ